jgi:deoxyxylulose-5-phosphate synthase
VTTFQITDAQGRTRNLLELSTAAALTDGPVMVRMPSGALVEVDPQKVEAAR